MNFNISRILLLSMPFDLAYVTGSGILGLMEVHGRNSDFKII